MSFIKQTLEKERDTKGKLDINLDKIRDEMIQDPSVFSKDKVFSQEQEDQIKDIRANEIGGCTAVMVYIKGNDLWCANAGDSRAIMVKNDGTVVPLS